MFADPQVAAAGATEQELIASGRPLPGRHPAVCGTAYGWALQDTTSFVKVLADPETRLLLGAHLIGPQASILIQPLVQAMCLGSTIDDVATGVLYIHPALTEVVEQPSSAWASRTTPPCPSISRPQRTNSRRLRRGPRRPRIRS